MALRCASRTSCATERRLRLQLDLARGDARDVEQVVDQPHHLARPAAPSSGGRARPRRPRRARAAARRGRSAAAPADCAARARAWRGTRPCGGRRRAAVLPDAQPLLRLAQLVDVGAVPIQRTRSSAPPAADRLGPAQVPAIVAVRHLQPVLEGVGAWSRSARSQAATVGMRDRRDGPSAATCRPRCRGRRGRARCSSRRRRRRRRSTPAAAWRRRRRGSGARWPR